MKVLDRLRARDVLDDVVLVPYGLDQRQALFRCLFRDPFASFNGFQTHTPEGKGFLSYVFEISSSPTRYLAHFDADMPVNVNPRFNRSWVYDALSALASSPRVVFSGLPVGIGDAACSCTIPELTRRGIATTDGGLTNMGDMSTQGYLVDLARMRGLLPVAFRAGNFEESVSTARFRRGIDLVANLPYARPPFYSRGGRHMAADAAVYGDAGPRCGPQAPAV